MPGWLKKLFGIGKKLAAPVLNSALTLPAIETALAYIGAALPLVQQAADFITKRITIWTTADDVAWAMLRSRYPTLLDGREKTTDELKLIALLWAKSQLMKAKPALTSAQAAIAAEAAVMDAAAAGLIQTASVPRGE